MIAIGHEGITAHGVTLGAYTIDKFYDSFISRSFTSLIDKGVSSWTMSHFVDLVKHDKLLKMLDTSIYFLLPSYIPFPNVA